MEKTTELAVKQEQTDDEKTITREEVTNESII